MTRNPRESRNFHHKTTTNRSINPSVNSIRVLMSIPSIANKHRDPESLQGFRVLAKSHPQLDWRNTYGFIMDALNALGCFSAVYLSFMIYCVYQEKM